MINTWVNILAYSFFLEMCTIHLVVETKGYCCRINNLTILCPMFLAWNSQNPKTHGLPCVLTWRERSLVCLSLPIKTPALLDQSLILMPSLNLYYHLLGPISKYSDTGVKALKYDLGRGQFIITYPNVSIISLSAKCWFIPIKREKRI